MLPKFNSFIRSIGGVLSSGVVNVCPFLQHVTIRSTIWHGILSKMKKNIERQLELNNLSRYLSFAETLI